MFVSQSFTLNIGAYATRRDDNDTDDDNESDSDSLIAFQRPPNAFRCIVINHGGDDTDDEDDGYGDDDSPDRIMSV